MEFDSRGHRPPNSSRGHIAAAKTELVNEPDGAGSLTCRPDRSSPSRQRNDDAGSQLRRPGPAVVRHPSRREETRHAVCEASPVGGYAAAEDHREGCF
eukprot:3328594-Pyramimonas_sp.AAC.1